MGYLISTPDLPDGTTGSGPVVLAETPTIASPTLTGTVAGSHTIPNSVLVDGSITIAGHNVSLGGSQSLAASDLINGTTGSGEVVLKTSPTIASPTFTGTVSGLSAGEIAGLAAVATSGSASDLATGTLPNARLSGVPNSALANSSIAIAGHNVALGGSQNLAASDLMNGTTGSGDIVLAAAPTIASPTFTGTVSGLTASEVSGLAAVATSGSASDLTTGTLPNARLSAVPNSALADSTITIAGHTVSLGSTQNLAASDLTNGTTGSGDIVLAMSPTLSNVDISGGTITGIPTPVNPEDVANKSYVDSLATGLSVHTSVAAATTTALPTNTYSNGSSGVGATLTASSNGALTVDGYAVQTDDRLLIKNEATGANNGVYVVTNPGSSGAPYVLTRATDFDDSANITPDSYFFVEGGSTNAASGWLMTTSEPITVGTTVIVFTQFSSSSAYLAGMGLTLTDNTFALTNSSITIAGHPVSLGGSQALAASDLTNGTTGAGDIVLATAPTIASPTFTGTVSGLSAGEISGLAVSATTDTTNASNITSGTLPNARLSAVPNSALAESSITIAGHTVSLGGSQNLAASDLTNGTTGSGEVVLGDAPTIASPTFTGTVVGAGTIPNAVLANSAVTIAGHSVALGGSQALTAVDLTFTNSNTGGVSETISVKLAQTIDVRDFGAVCDGFTDDTTAIQKAIDAAQAINGTVHLFGTCKITSTLTATNNVRIVGDGLSNTVLNMETAGQHGILFSPTVNFQSIVLEHFSIVLPGANNEGATYGICIGNNTYYNDASLIRSVGVTNSPNAILLLNSLDSIVDSCIIQYFYGNGIEINTPLDVDNGPAFISKNQIINNGYTSPAPNSILWLSGGGVSIENNYLLSGNIGFKFSASGQTSEVRFASNLVVDQNIGISLTQTNSGVAPYAFVEMIINANILDSCVNVLYVPSNSNGAWLYNLIFTDNTINSSYDTTTNQIDLYDTIGFVIANNIFSLNGTTSARPIFTDSSSINGIIGPNVYYVMPSPGGGSWYADYIASTNTQYFGGPQTGWTPTDQSGAGLSITVNNAHYVINGYSFQFDLSVTYPGTISNSSQARLSLPASAPSGLYSVCVLTGDTGSDFYLGFIDGNVLILCTMTGSAVANSALAGVTLTGSAAVLLN
jgi:hypothetical protein